MTSVKINIDKFKVLPGQKIELDKLKTDSHEGFSDKKEAKQQLKEDIKLLKDLQYQLYAENRQALLIVFQAMDAGGKDSAIRHIFSGVNPQGCEVHSFKKPSLNELEHDYFWRHYKKLPARGNIGIFNRSHYENVLITRVHPEMLVGENLPGIYSVKDVNNGFWEARYDQIKDFERTIVENGTTILKFFLHISKEKQKKGFLKRIENREKNWKFSAADLKERSFWDEYQKAYELAISNTSTDYAPWHVIPADHKWFSRVVIGSIIVHTLKEMEIKMPEISEDEIEAMKKAKQELLEE
ncbi:MAG: polyphosphate kinase 2 family protein [Bacteroidales bacterium]